MRVRSVFLGAVVTLSGAGMSVCVAETVDTNSRNFAADVLARSADRAIVVMFDARWCGPCRDERSRMTGMSNDADLAAHLSFAFVDVDDNPDIAAKYSIARIPAFVVFRNGEVIESSTGSGKLDGLIAGVTAATPGPAAPPGGSSRTQRP
jgi:thioredoxin 1